MPLLAAAMIPKLITVIYIHWCDIWIEPSYHTGIMFCFQWSFGNIPSWQRVMYCVFEVLVCSYQLTAVHVPTVKDLSGNSRRVLVFCYLQA